MTSNRAAAQAEFRSGHFLTSDGVELHYLEVGSGPTLVFVPGWTMPAWIWEHQLRHFASTHRAVAFDPRGQGRSEKPTYGYHAPRRALDIRELLQHLGGEPAVVVGWSLAVQEVLVLAHQFGTEYLRCAALVDHPIDIDPEVSGEIARERLLSLQVEREKWTRGFVAEIYRSPRSEEYLEEVAQAALSTPTNAAAIMMANLHFLGPTDLRPALASLDRPALFVFSALDWAAEAAERVREDWPAMTVEIIGDTSHALFVDRPEQFNRVLEEFLDGLDKADAQQVEGPLGRVTRRPPPLCFRRCDR